MVTDLDLHKHMRKRKKKKEICCVESIDDWSVCEKERERERDRDKPETLSIDSIHLFWATNFSLGTG